MTVELMVRINIEIPFEPPYLALSAFYADIDKRSRKLRIFDGFGDEVKFDMNECETIEVYQPKDNNENFSTISNKNGLSTR